jgi:hypothetical protein
MEYTFPISFRYEPVMMAEYEHRPSFLLKLQGSNPVDVTTVRNHIHSGRGRMTSQRSVLAREYVASGGATLYYRARPHQAQTVQGVNQVTEKHTSNWIHIN